MPVDIAALADRVRTGDTRALARAITFVEDETAEGRALVARLYPDGGRATVIGITGPPGAGKSTLVDQIVTHVRRLGLSAGVLAVDPTSPFSGGAILGDRVRMTGHASDEGVFIRSMATRGQLGGLARAADDAAAILAAAGKELVVIETVGVGQDEIDVAQVADVTIVVLVPGMGDEVQALKAGIMEIADIFVVNKADRDGADQMVQAIEMNLSLHTYGTHEWRPLVLKTVATAGEGVEDVWRAIVSFREGRADEARGRRWRRCNARLRQLVAASFLRRVDTVLMPEHVDRIVDRIVSREIDVYSAADRILREVATESTPSGSTQGRERA